MIADALDLRWRLPRLWRAYRPLAQTAALTRPIRVPLTQLPLGTSDFAKKVWDAANRAGPT